MELQMELWFKINKNIPETNSEFTLENSKGWKMIHSAYFRGRQTRC